MNYVGDDVGSSRKLAPAGCSVINSAYSNVMFVLFTTDLIRPTAYGLSSQFINLYILCHKKCHCGKLLWHFVA